MLPPSVTHTLRWSLPAVCCCAQRTHTHTCSSSSSCSCLPSTGAYLILTVMWSISQHTLFQMFQNHRNHAKSDSGPFTLIVTKQKKALISLFGNLSLKCHTHTLFADNIIKLLSLSLLCYVSFFCSPENDHVKLIKKWQSQRHKALLWLWLSKISAHLPHLVIPSIGLDAMKVFFYY